MRINQLTYLTLERLELAKFLVDGLSTYKFIRHNGLYQNDFAGHLLVFIAEYPDRSTIHIRDATVHVRGSEGLNIEKTFQTYTEALAVFNEIFLGDPCFDGTTLKSLIVDYGFRQLV